MNKSKVENGEVIEEFRKKFPYLSVHRYTTTDFNSSMSTSQCNEEVEAFITNALNQQRLELIGKVKEMRKPEETDVTKVNLSQLYGYNQAVDEFLTKLEGNIDK